jgi:hypothetical protein
MDGGVVTQRSVGLDLALECVREPHSRSVRGAAIASPALWPTVPGT